MLKWVLMAMLMGWLSGCAHAAKVTEKQLENGLTVLVREDRRAPVVVSQLWYRAGASDEVNGRTGLAHILEHMMFKGTETVPGGEFSRRIAAVGGRENAFTTRDFTSYYQQLSKEFLPLAMALESDRMSNLILSEADLATELEVVLEERRMRTDDQPGALLWERFNALAYTSSPYRHPIIGWPEDIRATTLEDVRSWYDSYYAPNNATLVIVGDVVADEVIELAETHFGPIPKRPIPVRKPQREVESLGPRRMELRIPAQIEQFMLGYPVPVLPTAETDWEPYALMVLAQVLDGGDSARLPRSLVRDQALAAGVSASYSSWSRRQSLFTFGGVPSEGHTVAELEAALRVEIKRVRSEPVGADELARVKAQVVAAEIYEQDSLYYQAMKLGMLASLGLGWEAGEMFVDRIQAITAAQVLSVAQKYLDPDKETFAVLVPKSMQEEQP